MRRSPFRHPAIYRTAFEIGWRSLLVGLALFVAPPFAAAPSAEQQALAFIGVVIWCYYDGAVWRRKWPNAVFEAMLWFFCAVKWTQTLLLLFGLREVV